MDHRSVNATTPRAPGPRPKRSLGQNFLRDRSVLRRIVAAAGLLPGDEVLEIGPGTGVLTEALIQSGARVTAIELDDWLLAALAERYAADPRVRLIRGDALQVDPGGLFPGPYKVVANIPYAITGPLLRRLLETDHPASRLVLMVQREVARRMAASPGDLSLLGVSVQYFARVRIVARVPATAFRPRPKVDSAVVLLEPLVHAPAPHERQVFFEVVRAGFHTRRKQLINGLAHGLALDRQVALDLLTAARIDPTRRAEELSVAEWERLAGQWQAMGPDRS